MEIGQYLANIRTKICGLLLAYSVAFLQKISRVSLRIPLQGQGKGTGREREGVEGKGKGEERLGVLGGRGRRMRIAHSPNLHRLHRRL